MRNTFGLSLVICLAFGLTDVACKTAVADIDKATVEAGRVLVTGRIDTAHDLIVRIDRGDTPIEWRSGRTGGGEFEVVVEASDKIRLEDGKRGHGVVVTTTILTSSAINYVHCSGDLAGTFAIRREADFESLDGELAFADLTLEDGKTLPVSLRLALGLTAAPVRADDAEDKVAFSPDGKTLASGTGNVAADKFDVEVKLWDVATGKERVLGKGHPIRAVSNAFSPDGKTLATSYLDPAAVKLWDVATGKEKLELGGVWGPSRSRRMARPSRLATVRCIFGI